MSAVARLRERFAQDGRRPPLKVLAASGQLGYGIPKRAFDAGLATERRFSGPQVDQARSDRNEKRD